VKDEAAGRSRGRPEEARVAVAIGIGRQVAFWIGALVGVVLTIWLLREILLPFVAGAVLAYLFNPLATRLERLGANRLVASLIIIGIFVLGFIVLLLLIVPVLGGQLAAFIENVPGYVRRLRAVIADPSWPWLKGLLGDNLSSMDTSMSDLVTQGAGWLTAFLKSLWSGGQALISIFSLVVVTPVVAFYLLYDWERMIVTVDGWVPLPQRETVRGLAWEIDRAIAGFVRGQSGVCLILGSFYAVGLTVVGLNFGLLIGLVSGLITFVPYLGSMTGLVLATGVAVAQFWPDWGPVVTVLAIFFVGQFVEGYILAPKLVGESVGLHPVWLMFALFAFGYVFGFVGMLLAVPLAAAIGVIVRFALRRYRQSPFYTGETAIVAADDRPSLPETFG
jgi:predicted PurR-regulated permease PerM